MRTYWTRISLFAGAALAAAAGALPAAGPDKPYDEVVATVASPDGKRTAFTARRGDKMLVVVDGVAGREYDGVQRLRFSADGSRVGCIAELPGCRAAVIDGVEGRRYIGGVRDLVFSPDGGHAAYVAGRGTPLNNHIDDAVVIDGVEKAAFRSIEPGSLCYSPDGRRLAFAAQAPGPGRDAPQVRVLVDGRPVSRGFDALIQGPDDEAALLFSPDSRRVAYLASRGEAWFVGVGGQEGKGYAYVQQDSVRFSPDGARLAYVAQPERGGPLRVAADGREGPAYDDISDLRFGVDGSCFVYTARRDGATYRVTDKGEESRTP